MSLQVRNQVLIEVGGCGNDGIREAGRAEHLVSLFRQICKVARIDTDTVFGQPDSFLLHLTEDADGIRNAGLQHVVSVDEKSAGIRINL